MLSGQLFNGESIAGMKYMARLKVMPEGGRMEMKDNAVCVKGADAATLLISAATDYLCKPPEYRGNPFEQISRQRLDAASTKQYPALRDAHVADYRGLFGRVRLDVGKSEARVASLPTNERLAAYRRGGTDPELEVLFFQMGRYLLIGSSRPGGPPAHLQGMWAIGYETPWACDYHFNINQQMIYWPAETTNLAECHEPLIDLTDSLRTPGSRTARIHYGARGWVVHLITNAWGFTSPDENPHSGQFPIAGGWLCLHVWDHYAFSQDRDYLRNKAWPILKESARFYLDVLVEDPRSKYLVMAPATEFENEFQLPDGNHATVCADSVMNIDILRELFDRCIQASRILHAPSESGLTRQRQVWSSAIFTTNLKRR